jgi:hypothetical protein
VADESHDILDYRDAIEELLLSGEELEAALPAGLTTQPDSDDPRAIALTSHRLVVCHRRLRAGSYDRWTFRSILYSRVEQIELHHEEQFRRDRIDSHSSVTLYLARQEGGTAGKLELRYADSVLAREVHDRILAHLLTVESRGLP